MDSHPKQTENQYAVGYVLHYDETLGDKAEVTFEEIVIPMELHLNHPKCWGEFVRTDRFEPAIPEGTVVFFDPEFNPLSNDKGKNLVLVEHVDEPGKWYMCRTVRGEEGIFIVSDNPKYAPGMMPHDKIRVMATGVWSPTLGWLYKRP